MDNIFEDMVNNFCFQGDTIVLKHHKKRHRPTIAVKMQRMNDELKLINENRIYLTKQINNLQSLIDETMCLLYLIYEKQKNIKNGNSFVWRSEI